MPCITGCTRPGQLCTELSSPPLLLEMHRAAAQTDQLPPLLTEMALRASARACMHKRRQGGDICCNCY